MISAERKERVARAREEKQLRMIAKTEEELRQVEKTLEELKQVVILQKFKVKSLVETIKINFDEVKQIYLCYGSENYDVTSLFSKEELSSIKKKYETELLEIEQLYKYSDFEIYSKYRKKKAFYDIYKNELLEKAGVIDKIINGINQIDEIISKNSKDKEIIQVIGHLFIMINNSTFFNNSTVERAILLANMKLIKKNTDLIEYLEKNDYYFKRSFGQHIVSRNGDMIVFQKKYKLMDLDNSLMTNWYMWRHH